MKYKTNENIDDWVPEVYQYVSILYGFIQITVKTFFWHENFSAKMRENDLTGKNNSMKCG